MADLAGAGIDLVGVTDGLLRDGVKTFADAFGQLMDGLAKKAATLAAT
jgi:hypothetical protein